MFRSILEAPFRKQWDWDSRLPPPDPGTAPGNCGMTAVEMIAHYYTDRFNRIYDTRRLSVTSLKLSTSFGEQRLSLQRRGVDCVSSRPTVAGLHNLLGRGIPVVIGMTMSLVPLAVAGHSFRGSHGVLLRANAASVSQGSGFLAADPNFSDVVGRVDPTNGRRFYPDAVVKRAYYDAGQWAIIPSKAKLVPALPDTGVGSEADELAFMQEVLVPSDTGRLFDCKAGVVLRTGPGTKYAQHHKTTQASVYRLLGFYKVVGGWVLASNPPNEGEPPAKSKPFWVPPDH